MSEEKANSIKPGDRVKLHSPGGLVGRIVELRGPLGPKGAQIYRLRLRGKPPSCIEVREDQLEVVQPEGTGSAHNTPEG